MTLSSQLSKALASRLSKTGAPVPVDELRSWVMEAYPEDALLVEHLPYDVLSGLYEDVLRLGPAVKELESIKTLVSLMSQSEEGRDALIYLEKVFSPYSSVARPSVLWSEAWSFISVNAKVQLRPHSHRERWVAYYVYSAYTLIYTNAVPALNDKAQHIIAAWTRTCIDLGFIEDPEDGFQEWLF